MSGAPREQLGTELTRASRTMEAGAAGSWRPRIDISERAVPPNTQLRRIVPCDQRLGWGNYCSFLAGASPNIYLPGVTKAPFLEVGELTLSYPAWGREPDLVGWLLAPPNCSIPHRYLPPREEGKASATDFTVYFHTHTPKKIRPCCKFMHMSSLTFRYSLITSAAL